MKRLFKHTFLQKRFFIVFAGTVIFLVGCINKKPSQTEIVTQYYQGFDKGNYSQITEVIGDSISITSGDYVSSYSNTSFYEFFKWDSVLQTRKKLLNLEDSNDGLIATIAYSSKRYKFLNNNHMTCKYRVNFEGDKISTLDELDCPNANWQAWEAQVNSLVNWIKIHYPELDGFIHGLTMRGAINYVKAMELYNNGETSQDFNLQPKTNNPQTQ